MNYSKRKNIGGYSITDLVVALLIVGVLTGISLPYIINYQKTYKSDEQSLKIMDLLKETGQLALTRRKTYRFEIDLDDEKYLIIDENGAGDADDTQIKEIPMESNDYVRVDRAPRGVIPPAPPGYNTASFRKDRIGHNVGSTRVSGNKVWAARFKSNGAVVDKDGNPLSATLFIWSPLSPGDNDARNLKEVRAVTLFTGVGAVRYWKYDGENFSSF